mmetsp:Transcript_16709/g.27099  ORF Transcript_16709/g.27099 Transcript_16709/m.27099 type:complete len:83 (-) Transcript_16709:617-865(-)
MMIGLGMTLVKPTLLILEVFVVCRWYLTLFEQILRQKVAALNVCQLVLARRAHLLRGDSGVHYFREMANGTTATDYESNSTL